MTKKDPPKEKDPPYPEFIRAGGECICPTCKKPYWKHPYDGDYTDWEGYPYLNILCDGTRVKL